MGGACFVGLPLACVPPEGRGGIAEVDGTAWALQHARMCRVLAYLGSRVGLDELITKPANSLVNQSFDPEHHHLLQLAGTGLASWDAEGRRPDTPFVYKNSRPSFYDRSLQSLCDHMATTNLLAHIRATSYRQASVHDENCHPFVYPKFRLALAHNGGLPGWRDMLRDIVDACDPKVVRHLAGSTDTEPLYCLLMSQYADPTADMGVDEIVAGLTKFMRKIRDIKKKHDNRKVAKLKFFLADGNDLVVANMGLASDYAAAVERSHDELVQAPLGSPERTLAGVIEPVWFLAGRDYGLHHGEYRMAETSDDVVDSVIVSSEQLTAREEDWKAVGFQQVVVFRRQPSGCSVQVSTLRF